MAIVHRCVLSRLLMTALFSSAALQQAAGACFPVRMAAGDYAHTVVAQDSSDVAIEIRSADSVLARVDAFEFTPESASLVAPRAGVYRFCILGSRSQSPPLRYTGSFEVPRAASPRDELQVHAERVSTEARQLGAAPGAVSLRLARERREEALALWRSLGDVPAQVAVLIAMGDALNGGGEFRNAIAKYREAREAAIALAPPFAARPEAEALANSGVAELRMGDFDAAEADLNRSLELFRGLSNASAIAAVENNLANLFTQTGEYQRALDSYLAALPVLRRSSRRSEAITLGNIGLAYSSLGDYSAAASWLGRSLPLFTLPADREAKALALVNLGRVQSLAGNPVAIPSLQAALALLADAPNPRARAAALNNLGQAMYRGGRKSDAAPLLAQAAALYRRIGDIRGLSGALHFSALAAEAEGDRPAALALLREALAIRTGARLDDDALASVLALADLETRAGELSAARADLDRAAALVEKVRFRIASPRLRAAWLASRRAVYEQLLNLLWEEAAPEPALAAQALELAERSRARSWMEEIGGAALTGDLALRERGIARRLNFSSLQLLRLPDAGASSQRTALLHQIEESELAYDSLSSEIARQAAVEPARPLSADRIRALLDEKTVLLEFVTGESCSYLFAVTAHEVHWYRLPPRAAIQKLADPVIAALRSPSVAGPAAAARLGNLYRILLSPVTGLMSGKRIVISPDGILDYVPFSALPAPGRQGLPLGVSNEVSGIPSASLLAALRARSRPAPDAPLRVAVFADPVFGGDPRLAPQPPDAHNPALRLARLPFSLREAGYIQAEARGAAVDLRVGRAAVKSALYESPASAATILHLATHARTDDFHPELSAIFLSGPDAALNLLDIYKLRLAAQMVVLSGCSTGLGREEPGEGFFGLARAFFYAGAQRLIVSLWPVDDEATALFMRAFYHALFASPTLSPSSALRAARQTMWRDPRWRDPFFWAGFSLEGDWNPLPAPEAGV